jgi:hypothetical protein
MSNKLLLSKFAVVLFILIFVTGCGNNFEEKYDELTLGMTEVEAGSVMGMQHMESMTMDDFKVIIWRKTDDENAKTISLKITNGKVVFVALLKGEKLIKMKPK